MMQFLQPIFLWGLLGISIPVLIHFWRGKKGRVVAWAAMHWLATKESAVAKGFRLENLLVLILRILLLTLLVGLLGKLVISSWQDDSGKRIVHLVQPTEPLVEEFRFELQQAFQKGEEVYWAEEKLTSIGSLEEMKRREYHFDLQASLNGIGPEVDQLNLYLENSQNLYKEKFFITPVAPTLFLGRAHIKQVENKVFTIAVGANAVVNQAGLLDSVSGGSNAAGAIDQARFLYFIGEEIPDSAAQFIRASLEAIDQVYGFGFRETSAVDGAKLVVDHAMPTDETGDKLYFISEEFSFPVQSFQVNFVGELDFKHAEVVRTGRLPEAILEKFLAYLAIDQKDVPISKSQLRGRFLVDKQYNQQQNPNLNLLLLSFFVICLGLERYFSNRQRI